MTYRYVIITACLLGGAAVDAATPGRAQDASSLRDEAKVVRLSEFDVRKYRDTAWFADELRGAEVHGGSGEQVGTVRSIILDRGGQVEKLVIEAGGVLGIGEKVVAVPWTEIDLTPGEGGVVARSLRADNVANFSLFDDGEAGATGPRSFRAAELEGDYVTLKDRAGYGYVRDLLFDRNGQLQALIVATDVAYDADGYYAYPFYGYDYGFEPGRDTYAVPYAEDDLEAYEPFEYDAWRDRES